MKSAPLCSLENLARRHQIGVLRRSAKKRPTIEQLGSSVLDWAVSGVDRVAVCPGDRQARYRHWLASEGISKVLDLGVRWGKPGRPAVSPEIRKQIRDMSRENPGWGAPRIRGELLKLGIDSDPTIPAALP